MLRPFRITSTLALTILFVLASLPMTSARAENPAAAATPALVQKIKSSVDMRPPTAADAKELRSLDERFKKSKSIAMKIEKTFTLAVLDKKEDATGSLLVSKGRLRMEMDPPNHRLVIVGEHGVWVVDYPPAEFKDAKLQVAHATGEKKSLAQQGLLGSLLKGRISSFFKVTNVASGPKDEKTFYLTPVKPSAECSRAQAVLAKAGKELRGLHYWDEQGNETDYRMSNVQMDAPIAADAFDYTPPKNADITPL